MTASLAHAANTDVQLVLESDTARPGDTVMAGIHLHMSPQWHTYWKNPGESGMATSIKWELPAGITAGEILWPPPEKDSTGGIVTYVYSDDVVLLVPLKLAPDLKPGPLELNAQVSWLECKTLCIPGKGDIHATLNIGAEAKLSPDAGFIQTWQKRLPKSAQGLDAHARWEQSPKEKLRSLILEWTSPRAASAADFFSGPVEGFEVQPATERIPADTGKIQLRVQIKKLEGDWPKQISGLLIQKSGTEREAYAVTLPIEPSIKGAVPENSSAPLSRSLWQMLLYAFIGGLILNIMPCVFPVIALKILGFVQQSADDPRRIFRFGLIYAAGVLVSFLILAGMVIAVQKAGGAASWGMQLGNAQFSLGLTVLVTLVALNLFGVFEITLGGRAINAAGQLAAKHGAAGAFFNGVLATILATPCTAPFLAPALGFAFVQPPGMIVLFFVTIALGLAAPYIILSWQPAWLKFLPKPGAWMEKFKIAMGFLMLATAVWLFWFTAPRFGEDGPLWLGLFLVVMALAAWIWGEFVQRGRTRKVLAVAISLSLLGIGYSYGLEQKLNWRSPGRSNTESIAWSSWSPEAVQKARTEGRPVLVDFTAKWCLTCNTIVKPAIENPDVIKRMKEINAVALLGDDTDLPPLITAELKKFGQAGVPLVLVYPKNAEKPPEVLPAALTKRVILDALARAAK